MCNMKAYDTPCLHSFWHKYEGEIRGLVLLLLLKSCSSWLLQLFFISYKCWHPRNFIQFLILQLEHRDVAASQTLRAALSKVEAAHPGFSYDLVLGLVKKADANSVNMNESLLRLQGAVQDQDCKKLYI